MSTGDRLAAGAKSATFGPAKVTQERWDRIWSKSPKSPKSKEK